MMMTKNRENMNILGGGRACEVGFVFVRHNHWSVYTEKSWILSADMLFTQ